MVIGLGYQELKDKVEKLLSKAPTQNREKTAKQFELLELLCQHREGQITSTDVTEASKQSKALTRERRKTEIKEERNKQ